MKGDDDSYCDATMVITEHHQGDEVVDSGDAEEMGNGPVEQGHDVETQHEQTEGETVGLIMENCYARLEKSSFEMQKSSLPFSHIPFATPGRIRNIQPISGIRISTFDGAMVFLFSWSQT